MDAMRIARVMIRIPRQALSAFWVDAGKAMLVTAVPCLVLDWVVLNPTRAVVFAVFFLTAGTVLVPLFYDGRRLPGVMPLVRTSWINETAGRKIRLVRLIRWKLRTMPMRLVRPL
jgi:hypothetical protein